MRLTTAFLAIMLASLPEALAQTVVAVQNASAPMLHITILEGEEALNNIRERTAREPIVQVEDSNHKPVAGVAVVFTSLRGSNGAGGTFNQVTSYRTVTDQNGRAAGKGFQPNTTVGEFSVQVEATLGASVATAVIHEINTLKGGGAGSSTSLGPAGTPGATGGSAAGTAGKFLHFVNLVPKWVVVAVVTGGVAAAAVAVTKTDTGATISSGGGTVTAPASRRGSGH